MHEIIPVIIPLNRKSTAAGDNSAQRGSIRWCHAIIIVAKTVRATVVAATTNQEFCSLVVKAFPANARDWTDNFNFHQSL